MKIVIQIPIVPLVTDALVVIAIVDKSCRVLKDMNAKVDNVSVENQLNALDRQIHVTKMVLLIVVNVVVLVALVVRAVGSCDDVP